MKKWLGAAGVCVYDRKVLMVLQGTPEEPKRWSVPSGGLEAGETFEECCVREIKEETGLNVEIRQSIWKKERPYGEIIYFAVKVVGGEETINDPDKLIYRIDWKSPDELTNLALSYPEDKTFLIEYIQNYKHDDLSIKNDRELIGEHLNNDIDEK